MPGWRYSIQELINGEIKKKPQISLRLLKVVGETGFEPATLWSQTRCATGLRYSPIFSQYWATPTGFEPVTYCLEGSCSIQLSYEVFPYRRCKNTTKIWEFIHRGNIYQTRPFSHRIHRKEKKISFFLQILQSFNCVKRPFNT